jgi:hypothetical protein
MTVAAVVDALHRVPGRGGDRVFGHYAPTCARSTGSSSRWPPRPQATSADDPGGGGPAASTSGFLASSLRRHRSPPVLGRTRRPAPERGDLAAEAVTPLASARPVNGQGGRPDRDGPRANGYRTHRRGHQYLNSLCNGQTLPADMVLSTRTRQFCRQPLVGEGGLEYSQVDSGPLGGFSTSIGVCTRFWSGVSEVGDQGPGGGVADMS